MLKCLVSENDTVVETLLSESVLEEEYLQEEVRKLSYLCTLRHHDTIWRTRIKMQRNENTTYCQGADWHGSLARGGGSPPLQGSKCERMSWHSCHSKIQTREKKDFFAALAHRFAVGNSCSHSHQVKTQNQSFCSCKNRLILDFHILAFKPHDLEEELPLLKKMDHFNQRWSNKHVNGSSSICCMFRIRIPRTKSEIESNYKRRWKKTSEGEKRTSGGAFFKHLEHNLISGNCWSISTRRCET